MNLPLDYEFMRGDREKSPSINSSHVNPRGLNPSVPTRVDAYRQMVSDLHSRFCSPP